MTDKFYVKVIPPSRRARIHISTCKHCRNGQGQENQDKGTGPTRWEGPYKTYDEALVLMRSLGPRYEDVGNCQYCKPGT